MELWMSTWDFGGTVSATKSAFMKQMWLVCPALHDGHYCAHTSKWFLCLPSLGVALPGHGTRYPPVLDFWVSFGFIIKVRQPQPTAHLVPS